MWKHGLKYGKIAEIFDQLTYSSARADTARPYSDLSNRTLKHRKEFIKNVLDARTPPALFPIDFDDPDAQLCASNFLEQNQSLFQHDPTNPSAQLRDLKYPDTSAEIVNVLAKIMCTQEVMYHRNLSSAESRKASAKDDMIDVDAPDKVKPILSPRRSTAAKDQPIAAKEQAPAKAQYFEREVLPENVKINLDASYPLDGKPDGTHSDWLFEIGSHWPVDLQPFTFRWMHEHKAYKLHGDEGRVYVRNFITALKRQVGLNENLDVDQEIKISKKVSKYLLSWAKTWSDCGLIVQAGDQMQRHRLLDDALKVRRKEYIDTVLDGRPENGPGMLNSFNLQGQGLKRSANDMDEELRPDVPEPLKRPKPDPAIKIIDLIDDSDFRPADGLRHQRRSFGPPPVQTQRASFPSPDVPEQRTQDTKAVISHPFAYSGIRSLTPQSSNSPADTRPANPLPSSGANAGTPVQPTVQPASTPTPRTSSTEFDKPAEPLSSMPFRYLPSLPPGTNARLAADSIGANKRHSLPSARSSHLAPVSIEDTKPDPRRISAPFTANGSQGSRSERASNEPLTPSTHDTKQSPNPDIKPSAPSLRLIVEKAEGSLNAENPLSEHDLRNCTLHEFFDKVTTRRQDPSLAIARLQFVQRWGAKTSFVVDRSTSDEEWKKVRGDIRRNFAFQSEKKPGKSRFEVYVICEADGASSEDEEEEY